MSGALFFVYYTADFRPVDKFQAKGKNGIIKTGEGNATEDAHGNDRRPGTEGTFSPKAGKRIRFVLCVLGNGEAVQPPVWQTALRSGGHGEISAGRISVWNSFRTAN